MNEILPTSHMEVGQGWKHVVTVDSCQQTKTNWKQKRDDKK